MVFTKKFFREGEKNLIEFEDLLDINEQGKTQLSSNFYKCLNKYFMSKEDRGKINDIIKTLEQLKKDYEEMNEKKSEALQEELNQIAEHSKQTFLEINEIAKQERNKIRKLVEEKKGKLIKQYKSEMVRNLDNRELETLNILEEILIKKFSDRSDRNIYGFSPQEVIKIKAELNKAIPNTLLKSEIKFKILQYARDNWKEGYKGSEIYNNSELKECLSKICDALRSGYDTQRLLETTQTREDKEIEENKDLQVAKAEVTIFNKQNEEIEESESGENDLYGN